MKVSPRRLPLTIKTAESARGIGAVRDIRRPAPAWCRRRKRSRPEGKTLCDIENSHDADDQQATSAKATTSARLITGGCSALLSGTGLPAASAGSARSLGRTRKRLSAGFGLQASRDPRATTVSGLSAITCLYGQKFPCSDALTGGASDFVGTAALPSCCSRQMHPSMHIAGGPHHDTRYPHAAAVDRAARDNALVVAAALVAAAAVLPGSASAQVLGYASMQQELSARRAHAQG